MENKRDKSEKQVTRPGPGKRAMLLLAAVLGGTKTQFCRYSPMILEKTSFRPENVSIRPNDLEKFLPVRYNIPNYGGMLWQRPL